MKLGRRWKMIVQGRSQVWEVGYPFTVKLKTSATGTTSANSAAFQIFNLPKEMREDIRKDFDRGLEYDAIEFRAGYDDGLPLPGIFVGNVYVAYTYRHGPDWITEISCLDGQFGMQNGQVDLSFSKDAKDVEILRSIAQAIPHLKIGHISIDALNTKRVRGVAVSGNAWEEIKKMALPPNVQVFVSDEAIYVLKDGQAIPDQGDPLRISPDMGMIGSPKRQATNTTVQMIFEPRLKVGRKVIVQSEEPYAGEYYPYQVEHAGIISPTVAGDLITSATFVRVKA